MLENDKEQKVKKVKREFKRKPFIIGIILAVLIIIIVATVVFSWGVYKLDWQGETVEKIISKVPFPAARVNSSYVSFIDYSNSLKAANKFYENQASNLGVEKPSDQELKEIVLEDRLIENVLMEKICQKYNIVLDSSMVDQEVEEIIKSKGDKQAVEDFLAEYYDLTLEQYIKYFIEPNFLYDQTSRAVADDESLNQDQKQKIQDAYNELNNGVEFEEIARKYSEDESAANGGLVGDVLRGDLPTDIEEQFFAMEEGDYSDVITLPGNFQIIKIEKKDDEKGVLTLKAIVVKIITLNDLIEKEKEEAKIKIYVY